MIPARIRGLLSFGLLAFAAALALPLPAQTAAAPADATSPSTITIRMYDARSGRQLTPNNYIVRFDHLQDVHNESLHIDDDGAGQVTLPAGASFLSVEGTFDNSTYIYINCDTGMEKDDRKLHWYSVATILSTGVIAPNECFNGKYEQPRLPVKPGEFLFYVRAHNWRDPGSY